MPTTVINRHHGRSYDVDIGRGSCWGNPFSHLPSSQTRAQYQVATREESITAYAQWIQNQPHLLARLPELRGKVLGCWCKPKECHGDILARLADQMPILTDIRAGIAACTACRLHSTRTQTVPGCGPSPARIMLVGEAPGQMEDEQGVPFVGPAGQLLTKLLSKAGIDRQGVYVSNVLKCRPPGNRDPKADEALACKAHLRAEYRVVQPKVIITAGKYACWYVSGISGSMGALLDYPGLNFESCPIVPIYHPSYLLRLANNPTEAKTAFQDTLARLIRAREKAQ